jgi:octaprenyl-diphosphate synthase
MTSPPESGQSGSDGEMPERFSLVFERIAPSLDLVERAMREQLPSKAELMPMLGDHVIASGGKRIRPALLILAADLCGYTGPRSIQIAAAIDLADLRRGQPSANVIWGNRRAVLGGDFFYARASSMIVEDGEIDLLEIFARTIRLMAEGELLQLQASFDAGVTEAHYYDVIDRKSASLLSAACEAGAIIGGVTRTERRCLAEFGRELGLAFQIKDDALDYDTAAATLGKQPFADLREGKVTLPLLLALKRCTHAEREQVAAILKHAARHANDALGVVRGDEESALHESAPPESALRNDASSLDFAPVLDLIERHHGITDSLRRADEHVRRATHAIAAFPDGPAKQALRSAAGFAVARER